MMRCTQQKIQKDEHNLFRFFFVGKAKTETLIVENFANSLYESRTAFNGAATTGWIIRSAHQDLLQNHNCRETAFVVTPIAWKSKAKTKLEYSLMVNVTSWPRQQKRQGLQKKPHEERDYQRAPVVSVMCVIRDDGAGQCE